jgi:8-amino-7-oxononanoate synthase
MAEAVHEEGIGSTGSRLLRGEREAFAAVERRFAKWKGAERSLYFSSGYLANLGVLATLAEPDDILFCDSLNHASLIDGARLSRARKVIFPHNDVDALERLLREETCDGQKFVVVESLFSMDGDFAPLAHYLELCRETGAQLIVDEAHAVGIYGPRGIGLLDAEGIITINTAGKAMGVAGAFVAAPEWAIEYLIQRARTFIFSTAPPPALAAALDASLDVLEQEPEHRAKLMRLCASLRTSLSKAGVAVVPGASQILAVVLGENERALAVASALQAQGFDVRAIRPPTVPVGTARLRISVNANLTEQDLDRFVQNLSSVMESQCAASL